MGFSKKDQFENKLAKVKNSLSEKNLKHVLEHDRELSMRNHSYSGRLQYLTILSELNSRFKKDFKNLTASDLKNFFANLKPMCHYGKKLGEMSQKSKWIYMCLIKSFFIWLYDVDDGQAPPKPVAWITRKKFGANNRKLLPKEIPTPEEVLKMVASVKHIRDKAYIFCLYESGCRSVSEFLGLSIEDITINERHACFNVKGDLKNDHSERTCYLIRSWPILREWIEMHPLKDNPKAPLWVSIRGKTYGEPLTKSPAARIVMRAAKAAGLKKKVWPHLLRHARALECAKKGYNNQVMNKMFGWSPQSKMASWYISLSESDVEEVVLTKEGLADVVKKETSQCLNMIDCPRCKKEWSAGTKFCTCGALLDLKTAIEVTEKREKDDKLAPALMSEMGRLQKQVHEMYEEMNRLKGNQEV